MNITNKGSDVLNRGFIAMIYTIYDHRTEILQNFFFSFKSWFVNVYDLNISLIRY